MILGVEVYGTAADRQDRHYLAGTVKLGGSFARARVELFARENSLLIAATLSDPSTGAWSISHVNEYPVEGVYIAIFDDSGSANAAIVDNLTQVTL